MPNALVSEVRPPGSPHLDGANLGLPPPGTGTRHPLAREQYYREYDHQLATK